MRVLIFGDSITYGEYDSQGGWADRLKVKYFSQREGPHDITVPSLYNLGVPNDTTKRLSMRLPHEIVARRALWEDETEFALVIAIGLNDSFINDDHAYASVPTQYAKDLADLYAIARLFSKKILFVGLTPIEERRMRYYSLKRIWRFEKALRKFVYEYKLPFVPLFEKFQTCMREEVLFTDGLHPNDEGHRLICDLVAPKLLELIRAEVAKPS